MRLIRRHRGAVLVMAALLGACAVGPDFKRPPTGAGDAYTRARLPERTTATSPAEGGAQRLAPGKEILAQWWTVFHNRELDSLIEEALRANPSVQAAQASLRQADELASAQRAAFFPQVQAQASAVRQKTPIGTLSPTLASGAPTFNLFTGQLNVGYAVDVFGGARRQLESLQAQADTQRYLLEAAQVTVATNVVLLAVQEASLREQLRATERMVSLESEQLAIMRRGVEVGASSAADADAQQVLLAQTQALIAPLRKQLAAGRDALSVLLGRLPSQEPDVQFEIGKLDLPEELPVSLPSSLVSQRPDVRAAEEQMHAASANVGVAIADMLPQLTLSATGGGTSTAASRMFAAGNKFWSAGANLSETLFDAGALYHRERAAVASLDQAGAQYRAAVLAAFQNVADTLQAIDFDAQAFAASMQAQAASERNLAAMRKAYELGSASYLALISAEQAYLQSVVARSQAQANRLVDSAALYEALGGGWWNRAEGGTKR